MDKNYASSLPAWARLISMVGAPTLIAFYLLGMIPGFRSPFDKITEAMAETTKVIAIHDHRSMEILRIFRLTCAGVWKGQPVIAEQCYNDRGDLPVAVPIPRVGATP